MPFRKVQPEKLSTSVVHQIEGLIMRGILRPGERLPSERDLSDRLGVSRPSLRDAISVLQEQGLLASRAGSGIYVADVLGSAFSPALVNLFKTHPEAVFDFVAFRRDLEALTAARAATYGSDTDLKVVQAAFNKMVAAHDRVDADEEARRDAQFHMSIIEASHNVVMLHMMRSMFDLLREGVFYNRQVIFRQRNSRSALLDQHRAINDGIQSRDPDAAAAAVRAHMDFVDQSLSAQQRSERNEDIARLRLEHETERAR
ncbi:MAG: FadR/GntR family transcriptional regulator [Paracoccaceae bacterium]